MHMVLEIYIYMVFGMSIVSSFSRRKQRFRMTLFSVLSSQLTQMIASSILSASSYWMRRRKVIVEAWWTMEALRRARRRDMQNCCVSCMDVSGTLG
uniref:Uncharacterized protein n=1 Tax=Oryza rufipogon TaxID=4529 RepID=A0A0E0PHF7_ORYRU